MGLKRLVRVLGALDASGFQQDLCGVEASGGLGYACRKIHNRGRPFATEVDLPDGAVVDMLDYGQPDGYAVVYEFESEPTPARIEAKVKRYTRPWIIRDVLVLDCRDAPTDLPALSEWVAERVVG